MNIPPVTPIPRFRPGERQDSAAERRRGRERQEKYTDRKGAFTGRLPSPGDNPEDRDEGSDPGRITDRTV